MTTINKGIKLITTAETGGAESKFATLDRTIENTTKSMGKLSGASNQNNMMLLSTSRIVQDLPYGFMGISNNITMLAEQMGYARSQGIGFKEQLIGIGKSLAGPGGMIFLISAITSAITYFTSNIGRAKTEVDVFAESIDKAIKKLLDFQDPLKNLKFGLDPQQLNALIPQIDKEIQKLEQLNEQRQISIGTQSGVSTQGFNAGVFLNQLTDKEKERQKINSALIDQLKTLKSEYEAQVKVAEMLDNLGLKKVEKEKQTTKELEKQLNLIKGITGGIASEVNRQSTSMQSGIFISRGGAGIDRGRDGRASSAGMTRRFVEMQGFVNKQITEDIQILKNEFSEFWQDTFGEANSLLEKFLMNFAEGLMELGTKRLVGGLLDIVFGVATGGASMALKPQIINVNIGDETLASVIVKGTEQAKRLRKM